MLNIVFSGKRRQFESVDQMVRKLGVSISNSDRGILRKADSTGDVLYASVNPYQAEMSSGEVKELVFAQTQESLDDLTGRLREEV